MATNMYLRFEEPAIDGTSTVPGHEKELEVLSWNHGFVQPTSPTRSTAGGGAVEQANHQNFTFTKYLDAATNALLKYCWSGKQFGKVTLSCFRSQGSDDSKAEEYLSVVMQHVVISNYSVSGGPGDVPVENISLDYGLVTYNYKEQRHDDSATHDRKTGKIS